MKNHYFPRDYIDSRARFLNRLQLLAEPKKIEKWKIPSLRDADLTVDSVYLPALENLETLFVLTSGIHGSETYAGSACIEMFWEEIWPSVDRRRTGFFVVHGMNPYGFKYHERCTENHVNLNRNFSATGEIFKIKNEESFRMCTRFLKEEPVQSLKSFLIDCMKIEKGQIFFDEISVDSLIKATAPGQFLKPEHMEYGGLKAEPQTQLFIDKMKEIMPLYQDIVGLDLHTGLGHRGRLHLIAGGAPGEDKDLITELFDQEKDREFYEITGIDEEGFYDTYGCLNNIFVELKKTGQRACGITLEFGTLGHSLENQIDALNRSLNHHQGQFFGYCDINLEKQVKALHFERSYPDDDQWREDVVKAARGLFKNVLKRAQA
jgi:hypothetical protein